MQVVSPESMKLSAQQRKYYFAVVVPRILEYYELNPAQLFIDVMKLEGGSWTKNYIHEFLKKKFNKGRSTSKLLQPPEDFLLAIRADFGSEKSFDIPPPNEQPLEQLTIN